MNSFISWVGGKMALRDDIRKRFPLLYKLYVEVFGGAGMVLFHKLPDTPEIFNDYNANLVNLYRIYPHPQAQPQHIYCDGNQTAGRLFAGFHSANHHYP